MQGISIGAQDVSAFPSGKYTGEIAASSLNGLVSHAIIGHSERRRYLQETPETLEKKVEQAHSASLKTVFCVRGPQDPIPASTECVAYEPVEAIGNGQNASLQSVIEMKDMLPLPTQALYIYGGSVDEANVQEYLTSNHIDGVLPGTASLDPDQFYTLILNAETALH
jgi:triosephosphate isomerase